MLSMMFSISSRRHHLADFVFDFGEDLFGLFEARPGGCAGVQAHGAGIHGREEIAADQRRQAQRAADKQEEGAEHRQRGDRGTSAAGSRRRRASVRSAG